MKKIADYINLPYTTYIIPDEGVDGKAYYRAEHPQLPGCMSHGQTPEEAFKNLADARRLYIQTRLELGFDIPVPPVTTINTLSSDSSIMLIPEDIAIQVVETDMPAVVDMHAQKAA